MANAAEHLVGRSRGHEWAVFMATSGQFCWPPMGTNYWPLTQQNTSWENRILPQAAFHMREQVGSGPAMVRTLATNGPNNIGTEGQVRQRSWGSPLPAWNELQPGEAEYAALYPFGSMNYEPFKTDVSMRFFSPIVAKEDRPTSLPVAYFDLRIANHTGEPANVSAMFTMPNAPAHVAGTRNDETVPAAPASVRTGFSSRYENASGVHGVTLSADDPTNTPDSAKSEWTIAAMSSAGQKVSYATSWNAEGDGSDIYAPFSADGRLPNGGLDESASAGAINVSAKLAPGEVSTIKFALAWDFPQLAFDDNRTVYMKRYTNFYGAKETPANDYIAGSYPFRQGFAIARDALVGHVDALKAVQNWWNPIATDPAYPQVLRTAALNQLSAMVFNNSFWEGGLVRNEAIPTGFATAGPGQHLGADRPDTHHLAFQDHGGGGISGTGSATALQPYGYSVFYKLFPNLFRDNLLTDIEIVERAENHNGADPFNALVNPFITWGNAQDATIQGGSDSRPPQPGQSQWLDTPSKFILKWYAYSKINNDTELLRSAWPAIKHHIAYLQGTIPAGTHLPFDAPAFASSSGSYAPGGPQLYNSQLYLLALAMGIATGEQLGLDAEYVTELRKDFVAAKAELELIFWNPVQQHYRAASTGVYADAIPVEAFFAQHVAESFGLPDLIDPIRRWTHLSLHHDKFPRYNDAGEMIGAPALVQLGGVELNEPSLTPFVPTSGIIVPAFDYMAAADYVKAGQRYRDSGLTNFGLELGNAVTTQIWHRQDNGFAFAPPAIWNAGNTNLYYYPGYIQNMAVWDLIDSIKPIPAPVVPSTGDIIRNGLS